MNGPIHNADTDKAVDGEDETMAMPRIASRMALITGLVVLLLASTAALLTEATSPITAPDCASIDDAHLRLKCYDSSARRLASPPARGAIAPKTD